MENVLCVEQKTNNHMEYTPHGFMIFEIAELGLVDFSEVMETSIETVALSVDGTKTFVKWMSETVPTSIYNLNTKEGPYTYEEMIDILKTNEWAKPNPRNL